MPTKANAIEYQTVVVGAAYLVKGILRRLDFVSAIDNVLQLTSSRVLSRFDPCGCIRPGVWQA